MNLALPLLLIAAAAPDPAAVQRATDVLARARQALGGERAAAVRSVSLEAELRRVQTIEGADTRDLSGELTVDALLPDRYLKVETLSPMPGMPGFSIGAGLDKGEAWRAPLGGGGGGHVVVRVAGADGPGGAELLLQRTRAEMVRFMLVALAAAPDAALTFVHAGEAEAPEGRADRIDVLDGQARIGTLFVDTRTHRPLMMSFRTMRPRMAVMRRARGEDDRGHHAGGAEVAPPPEVDAQLYVSEWKPVNGVLLPHRISQTVEGGTSEEWTVKKWTVDAEFKADHFRKRK
jgi:hypothetical protein